MFQQGTHAAGPSEDSNIAIKGKDRKTFAVKEQNNSQRVTKKKKNISEFNRD